MTVPACQGSLLRALFPGVCVVAAALLRGLVHSSGQATPAPCSVAEAPCRRVRECHHDSSFGKTRVWLVL